MLQKDTYAEQEVSEMDARELPLAMVLASALFAHEANMLTESEMVTLFQNLLDTGIIWALRPEYAKHAASLLDLGLISDPELLPADRVTS